MRKQVVLLSAIPVLLLSGCSSVSKFMENKMFEASGIAEEHSYTDYQEYRDGGKLDLEGYYAEESPDTESAEDDRPSGAAHLTFAENRYLDVAYFSDAGRTKPVDTKDCNLVPGDALYATVSVGKEAANSMYTPAGFYICQYAEGIREQIAEIPAAADGFILQITPEQSGAELSIEPYGAYGMRTISLQDYYTDEEGTKKELSGKWTVNDGEYTEDSTVAISALSSYIISYKYDSSEYFHLSSEPQCFYSDNADGIVIFEERKASDETDNYSVELRKYVTVDLLSKQDRNVSVNGLEAQTIKAGNTQKITQLKYGDRVTIATDKEWPELLNSRELICETEESLTSGVYRYKYTSTVPQKGGEFVFHPNDYTYEHGKIVFKCFGEEVTNTQYLAAGTKITYEGIPDEGYQLADGDHVIKVGGEEETKRQLKDIHFIESVKVAVALEQPKYGGTIRYFDAAGDEILETSYQTLSGAKIRMEFFPWEGWISHFNKGEVYEAGGKPPWSNIDDVFSEDPDHKPELEVILDKSVGENMKFTFEASGLGKEDYHYEDGWFRGNYTVVKSTKIGTEKGISLSMGNRAIQSGKAIKILVEREESDKKKSGAVRLINDLTQLQEPILIYEDPATSRVWYQSIKITISVVDAPVFEAPPALQHAVVSVKNADTLEALEYGKPFEADAKVIVAITPNSGYYVTGKNVKDNVYQQTMKFTKYQSDIREMIDKHPVLKYCNITLDAGDAYGTCTYKLDGDVKTGLILAKEGQKLTLEYTITSDGYVIEDAKGIVFGIGKDDQAKTVSMSVTTSMDGQKINRDTFGIRVAKGR